MLTISCAVCGVKVEGARSRQKYCSAKCKERGRPRAGWQGGTRRLSAPHGSASRYRRGCRCAECREAQRVSVAAYAARVKAEHGVVPSALYKRRKPRKPRRACGWCGEVHPTGYDALRRTHAQWSRYYEPSQSQEVALYEAPAHTRRTTLATPKRPTFVAGPCAWCGESFVALTFTGIARVCSSRCRRKLSAQRRFDNPSRFAASPARRARLYERDGHTCQICFQPTSATWSAEDPWSPTLDHIEPQASAPDPDHSDENLRLAHAICNSYRRDGAISDAEVRGLVLKKEAARVSP